MQHTKPVICRWHTRNFAPPRKKVLQCQFNLALMYEKGIGVPQDEKEAVVWYRRSAEQGFANAQFNLGVLYENGRGCAVDFAQAKKWYRKASAQGDALAIAIWVCSICAAMA